MKNKQDPEFLKSWFDLTAKIGKSLGKRPADLNAILFLIGVQELGKGMRDFSRDEKQDLMHIATCKVLSYTGFYTLEGRDEDGWPHWKKLKELPHLALDEQEKLIKMGVLEYFDKEIIP